jgi:hypothetical protein
VHLQEPEAGPRGEGAATSAEARGSAEGGAREPGSEDARALVRERGSDDAGAGGRRGWVRLAVTIAVLGAVWWPARPGGSDGFPLSSYPMFGYARAPTSVVDTVLGVGADGRRRPLSPELLAGVSQPKLALERIRDAIRHERADALCKEVAARVALLPAEGRPVALEVVSDRWDTLEGLEPGAEPKRRVVHQRCEVGG